MTEQTLICCHFNKSADNETLIYRSVCHISIARVSFTSAKGFSFSDRSRRIPLLNPLTQLLHVELVLL